MTLTKQQSEKMRSWSAWFLVGTVFFLIWWLGGKLNAAQAEKKILEEAKQQERLRAEAIIVSCPFALIMCDIQHHIVISTPAAEKLFGWSHDELVGQPISILIPPENSGQLF